MRRYTTGQVGKMVGLTAATVRDLCDAGDHFQDAKWDGKQWRIPQSDVDAYKSFCDELTERRRGKKTTPNAPNAPNAPKQSE